MVYLIYNKIKKSVPVVQFVVFRWRRVRKIDSCKYEVCPNTSFICMKVGVIRGFANRSGPRAFLGTARAHNLFFANKSWRAHVWIASSWSISTNDFCTCPASSRPVWKISNEVFSMNGKFKSIHCQYHTDSSSTEFEHTNKMGDCSYFYGW